MKFKAVLGIKSLNSKEIKKYRIMSDTNEIRDIPVDKIKEALTKGIVIDGLEMNNNKLIETTELTKIPKLRLHNISLYDWCMQNEEQGQRILNEFNGGNNFPITAKDIAAHSTLKVQFRCNTCGKINNQMILSKTRKNPIGCKYCNTHSTSFGEQLIYLWLLSQGLEVYNQYKIQTTLGTKEFDIYILTLNLAIEHQSNRHATTEKQFCDDTAELIAQQLRINLLEICKTDSYYQRQESNWCITYKLNHESEMITKLSLWLNTNYSLNTNPTYPRALEDQAYLNSCKVKYENSLAYHNPPFLKEWNQELNGKVTPDKVALNSNRKYYWTCSTCNHIYLASPSHRNAGTGCPNWRNHNKY